MVGVFKGASRRSIPSNYMTNYPRAIGMQEFFPSEPNNASGLLKISAVGGIGRFGPQDREQLHTVGIGVVSEALKIGEVRKRISQTLPFPCSPILGCVESFCAGQSFNPASTANATAFCPFRLFIIEATDVCSPSLYCH